MDSIFRGTLKDHAIRFFFADTTQTVQKMKDIHNTTPTATAAAGRLLTAAALMGCTLKNSSDLISLIIDGNGPMKKIIAVSDYQTNVKCEILTPDIPIFINDSNKLDVAKAVGSGTLSVVKDLGLKEPFAGTVKLVTSEIGDDLTYYFAKSEQLPSVVALGVLVNQDMNVASAGGFIIQVMPECDEEIIAYLEKKINTIKPLTSYLNEGLSIEDIAKEIFGDYKFAIHHTKKPEYFCNCSKEKVEKMLISLGRDDLNSLIEEQEKTEIKCHFCNINYEFSRDDLMKLL